MLWHGKFLFVIRKKKCESGAMEGEELAAFQQHLLQMDQSMIEANFKFATRTSKVTSFEKSVQLPIKVDGQWNWGSRSFVTQLEDLFEGFICLDSDHNHGLCQNRWPIILAGTFPEWSMLSLKDMLVGLCLYAWKTRFEIYQTGHNSTLAPLNFVEFFAASGNLSKACLQTNLQGVAFDIDYSEMHDMSTASAARLAFESIGHTVVKAMVWFGTPCSSFTALCQNKWERNMFLGADPMVPFVAEGNHYMDLSAMLFLISFVVANIPGLEQPLDSRMPLAGPMALVLHWTGSSKCVTYGAAFGASSLKPWQLIVE